MTATGAAGHPGVSPALHTGLGDFDQRLREEGLDGDLDAIVARDMREGEVAAPRAWEGDAPAAVRWAREGVATLHAERDLGKFARLGRKTRASETLHVSVLGMAAVKPRVSLGTSKPEEDDAWAKALRAGRARGVDENGDIHSRSLVKDALRSHLSLVSRPGELYTFQRFGSLDVARRAGARAESSGAPLRPLLVLAENGDPSGEVYVTGLERKGSSKKWHKRVLERGDSPISKADRVWIGDTHRDAVGLIVGRDYHDFKTAAIAFLRGGPR